MSENHTYYILEHFEWVQLKSWRFPIAATMSQLGVRCGYIGLPPHHLYYGHDYNSENIGIPVDCHYGLSFGQNPEQQNYPVQLIYGPNYHWIGFDCNHISDLPDPFFVAPEFRNRRSFSDPGASIKSLSFVLDNLYSLAEQLAGVPQTLQIEHQPSVQKTFKWSFSSCPIKNIGNQVEISHG